MSNSQKPIDKLSIFPLSCALWRNARENRVFFNATFEKSFKDESGKWSTTASFAAGDLLVLAKLCDMAHTRIIELRAKERQSDQVEEDAA
jgi:hypothetical protein